MAKKTPHRREAPPSGKNTRSIARPDDVYSQKLKVSLRLLDFNGPFGWSKAETNHFQKALARIKELEGLTWREILVVQRKWNHPIPVEQIAAEAQTRLSELNLDQYDEVTGFRVESAFRQILGYSSGRCPQPALVRS